MYPWLRVRHSNYFEDITFPITYRQRRFRYYYSTPASPSWRWIAKREDTSFCATGWAPTLFYARIDALRSLADDNYPGAALVLDVMTKE